MYFEQSFIDELRERADIVRIIGDHVKLKKKGRNWMGCCPFHDEKTPSFSVSAEGFFKCFGCDKGGSVFNYLMEIEGLSFPEAVKEVAERSGVPLPEPVDKPKFEKARKRKEKQDREKKKVIELNQIAMEHWEEQLRSDKPKAKAAREYLESRGIDQETINTFRIGYSEDSWETMLNLLKEKGYDEKLIRDSGLVTYNEDKDSVYDRFRGRVMFPVLDINGDPIAFGARILGKGEPKYLNSPETPAYTKGRHLYGLFQTKGDIRRQKYSILVEGYLDLIALHQSGVKNSVASLGTALTDMQARLLGRFARKVAVNYDGDGAGIKAAKRAIETFLAQDFDIKVLVLPDGMDPDDYIRSEGFEAYKDQHRKHALSYIQFVLENTVREFDLSKPKEKAAAIDAILPVLKAVRNTVEKRETLKQALSYFQIDDRVLEDHVWKEVVNETKPDWEAFRYEEPPAEDLEHVVVRRASEKITVAEKRLLEFLIHDAEIRETILPELEETDWKRLATAPIFEALFLLESQGVEKPGKSLLEMTENDPTIHDLVPDLLMSDAHREPDEAVDEFLIEAEKCAARLRAMAVSRQIRKLNKELVFAEQNDDRDKILELSGQSVELARLEREIASRLLEHED